MNKRYLHHIWKKLRVISYWYFLAGFILFSALFIYNYRQNNLNMIRLRDKVFVADEENQNVEGALRELREYVYSHMNARLVSTSTAIWPPIQLKYQYERDVAKEKAQTAATNAKITQEATAYCEAKFPVTLNVTGRQPCIEGYLADHGVKEKVLPKENYQFDFVSPAWSPDAAGWSLVLAALFGVVFIVRYVLERWLRHEFSEHA